MNNIKKSVKWPDLQYPYTNNLNQYREFMQKNHLIKSLICVKLVSGIEHSDKTESGYPHTDKQCGFFTHRYSSKNKSIRGDSGNVQGLSLKALLSDFLRVFNPRKDFINPLKRFIASLRLFNSPGAFGMSIPIFPSALHPYALTSLNFRGSL